MALQKGDKTNFETLLKAAKNGDLALIESTRVSDGSYVALIAVIYQEEPGGDYVIVPLGEMVPGDPYELYTDPSRNLKKRWSPGG